MKRLLLALLLTATVRAAPLEQPGPVLSTDDEKAWSPLFEQLAARRTIFSTFIEERWFGFRKTPVTLEGEMRLDPERGLSLHYSTPEQRVVVMDSRGLLLRDPDGRTRELPADPRAASIERALLPALRFNLPEIRDRFVVHAVRAGADWRLDLEPRDPTLARTLGNLVIEGTDRAVKRLEFRRSATQRVVITIVSTWEGLPFSDADLSRFFR